MIDMAWASLRRGLCFLGSGFQLLKIGKRDMHRAIRGRRVINDVDFYQRYPERFHCTVLIELPKQGPLDRPWSVFGRLWRS
jgi:hypothetical protein